MTETYVSGLWNAVDALLAFWAKELENSLENTTRPPVQFWDALAADLETAKGLAMKVKYR